MRSEFFYEIQHAREKYLDELSKPFKRSCWIPSVWLIIFVRNIVLREAANPPHQPTLYPA